MRKPFQSSPGTLAGRYFIPRQPRRPNACFNPRPALWPGATPFTASLGKMIVVSILARHSGRALPPIARGFDQVDLFQSSPGTLAGRYDAAVMRQEMVTVFQSSPGTLAGRYQMTA